MSEARQQYEIVLWFCSTWPELRGLLFEVNNNTYSARHGVKRTAMGMIPGISDLILISPETGMVNGIEIKAVGSVHKKEHVITQLNWGELIVNNGGNYIMSSNIEDIKLFIIMAIIGKKTVFNFKKITTRF
jgi:hypothetical protein